MLFLCAGLGEKRRGETECRCADECRLMAAKVRIVVTVVYGQLQMYPSVESRNDYLCDRVELLCVGTTRYICAFICNREEVGGDNARPLREARKKRAVFIVLVDRKPRPLGDRFDQTSQEAEETFEILRAEKLCEASNRLACPCLFGTMLDEYFQRNRRKSPTCEHADTGHRRQKSPFVAKFNEVGWAHGMGDSGWNTVA